MIPNAPLRRTVSAVLALACFAAFAPVAWAGDPPAGPKKVATIEGITEYQLANGVRFLMFPDQAASTVTVNMTVFVGSRHEGYGETGMAHLLEHMVFKGTPAFPNGMKALQEMGADFNGTTWVDRTNYFETMPATDKHLEFGIKFEADRLLNSYVKREDLLTEMTVVRNEFERGENSPENMLSQRMMATAYEWHNYGKSTIGNRTDIERVPIDRLQAFYKKYYQPDNVMLVVSGKFDEKKAMGYVLKYFGGLKRPTRVLDNTYTEEPAQDGERHVILRRVGTVGAAGLIYHIPAGRHPDFAAVDVLDTILTDVPSGRLYKALVETKKATEVGSSCYAWHDPGALEIIARVGDKTTPEQLRDLLVEQVEKELFAKPITDAEVDRAKQRMLKARERSLTNSKQIAIELSEWAGAGDWRLLFMHRDAVAKVTTQDVNAVVAKYFKDSNRTSGVFLPQNQVARATISPAPDVTALVKDYKGGKGVSEGEAFDPTYANIDARTKRTQLSGGVKVAFLEKKTRGDKVQGSLTLHFGNEKSLTGQTAVARFMGSLLTKGTSKLSRQEIQDQLDKLGATLGATSGPGTLTISFQAKRDTMPGVLKLLGEILRDPSFPQNEFDIQKQSMLQSFEKNKTEPNALAQLALQRKLSPYPKDNIRYIPTIDESIERIKDVTRDQVVKMYKDQLGATSGEFVVIGDFDGAATLKQMEAILGGWKSPVAYARIASPAIEGIKGGREVIQTPDKQNAIFIAGLTLPLTDEAPEYAALELGNYVLGGSTTSRLWDKLRQKEGLSYGAGSQFRADSQDKNAGFFLYAICNPDNMAKADKAVAEVVELYLKGGITEDELKQAKKGYLEESKVERARDGVILGYLRDGLYLGRPMKYYSELEDRIEALTTSDINNAMRAHLAPDRLIIIQAGDFNKKKTPDEPKK